jgi:hypothetical protein
MEYEDIKVCLDCYLILKNKKTRKSHTDIFAMQKLQTSGENSSLLKKGLRKTVGLQVTKTGNVEGDWDQILKKTVTNVLYEEKSHVKIGTKTLILVI